MFIEWKCVCVSKKCLLAEKVPIEWKCVYWMKRYLPKVDMAKGAGWIGSSQSSCGLKELRVKTGHFKWFKKEFRSIGLWVGSGWLVFFTWIYLFFYKESNMYLLFEKSCNKLLNVKCITLNSPLISRMNSINLLILIQ